MKVLTLKQEPRKKPVKVLDYKTGTENRTDCLKLVSPSYTGGPSREESPVEGLMGTANCFH